MSCERLSNVESTALADSCKTLLSSDHKTGLLGFSENFLYYDMGLSVRYGQLNLKE